MKRNLEIIESSYIYAKRQIEDLQTKELVPKMMFRRRLSRAAKIAIYLCHKVGFQKGKILYGSNYGEFPITTEILEDLYNNLPPSPTSFQNSVYNTAVSYLSILNGFDGEILTISSGFNTSNALLKSAIIKSDSSNEILILAIETLHTEDLTIFNDIEFLESGVALRVKPTQNEANLDSLEIKNGLPKSIAPLIAIAEESKNHKTPIMEVKL